MASFSTLPIELKLYIGQFLLVRDHYRYVASCHALWDLSCDLVARRKKKIEYWCLTLDTGCADTLNRLLEIYEDPLLLDLVTAVLVKTPSFPMYDLSTYTLDRDAPPSLSIEDLDNIVLMVAESSHEQRLGIFDRLKKHTWTKVVFPLFTRNVEFLQFVANLGVRQMLNQVYRPLRDRLHLPFPKLSHIRIQNSFSGGLPITLFEIKLLAQIPTLRCIRCEGVTHEPERGQISPVPINELELIKARVWLEDRWRDFFVSTPALERLHYTHDYWFQPESDSSIHVPRVIINCLLDSASKSLTTLILDDEYQYPSNFTPCNILKAFIRLEVLRCKWRDIVPECSLPFLPFIFESRQIEVDSALDQAQPDFILSPLQQKPKYKTLLADILPESLKHLTLSKCYYSELHHIQRYVESETCQLDTLSIEMHDRVDSPENTGLEPIRTAMRAKNIRLHDGCAVYAEKAQPDSWIDY